MRWKVLKDRVEYRDLIRIRKGFFWFLCVGKIIKGIGIKKRRVRKLL